MPRGQIARGVLALLRPSSDTASKPMNAKKMIAAPACTPRIPWGANGCQLGRVDVLRADRDHREEDAELHDHHDRNSPARSP